MSAPVPYLFKHSFIVRMVTSEPVQMIHGFITVRQLRPSWFLDARLAHNSFDVSCPYDSFRAKTAAECHVVWLISSFGAFGMT